MTNIGIIIHGAIIWKIIYLFYSNLKIKGLEKRDEITN